MSSTSSVVCLLCDAQVTIESLHEHIYNHMDYNPFECRVCGARFTTRQKVSLHKINHAHYQMREIRNAYMDCLVERMEIDCIRAHTQRIPAVLNVIQLQQQNVEVVQSINQNNDNKECVKIESENDSSADSSDSESHQTTQTHNCVPIEEPAPKQMRTEAPVISAVISNHSVVAPKTNKRNSGNKTLTPIIKCLLCDCDVLTTTTEKETHVWRRHSSLNIPPYGCPIPNCDFAHFLIAAVAKHIGQSHGMSLHGMKTKFNYTPEQREQYTSLYDDCFKGSIVVE